MADHSTTALIILCLISIIVSSVLGLEKESVWIPLTLMFLYETFWSRFV